MKRYILVISALAIVGILGFLLVEWLHHGGYKFLTNTEDQDNNKEKNVEHFYNHDDELKGSGANYYKENNSISGYISIPENANKDNKTPGIILIHEWWGLNEDIKQMADDYAKEGYTALAVDMYGKKPTEDASVARSRSSSVRNNMEEAMSNLGAAVNYLKNRNEVNSNKIASVGWCFGGGRAYQMAKNNIGIDASVMYYGQFDPQDDFKNMKASILGHFGEEDKVIDVNNAREFKAKLKKQDKTSSIYIYPNVGHSFANYDGGNNLDYNKESAKKAWNRTLNFLENRLN